MTITRDEIIKMLLDSGCPEDEIAAATSDEWNRLIVFAALVAAAEREACAKVCEELPMYGADDETADWYGFALADSAAAIRARGEK